MVATTEHVDLQIEGMTCASCAARIERRLNKIEGVTASVNYATESASVAFPNSVTPADLVAEVEAVGYGAALPPAPGADAAAAADEAEAAERAALTALRNRVIVSAVLGVPVIVLAMVPALQFDRWQWLSLALTVPIIGWCALPFHRVALVGLRHRSASMDTLLSIGTLAAFGWSLYALVLGTAGETGMKMEMGLTSSHAMGGSSSGEIYLEAVAAVTLFVLAGRWAEARAKRRSGAALRALLQLGAKDVVVIRDGVEQLIGVEGLVVGDRFVVRPGDKIATDGVVEEGSSAIDASLVTGESVPIEVQPGDAVNGATINAGGRLVVRATRVGADTQLSQMARLVTQAQSGKAEVQRLADRVSAVFVPVVIAISAITLVAWLASGAEAAKAFSAAVAVLIVACPCALGLATPTALLVGTGRGAQLGLLISGPEVLESTRAIDTILLDKTGTVTTGVMSVAGVSLDAPSVDDPADAWRVIGALEHASEHPVARAIVAEARQHVDDLPAVEEFASSTGFGVEGVVEGVHALAGRPAWITERGFALSPALEEARRAAEAAGHTVVVGAWGGAVRVVIAVADTVKPTSAAAIRDLVSLGLHPVLLTGDNESAARTVAAAVGIDEVIAGVLPQGKLSEIERLQAEGRVVAMVGDGVNDAAALVQADLGLAMGTGTDAAIEAGDITLVRGDLRSVPDAIRLSRRTLATIKANLFWAFAYNCAALPIAALGLLNPAIAGAAMAASSVFVVSNSLRLRRFTPSSSGRRSEWVAADSDPECRHE